MAKSDRARVDRRNFLKGAAIAGAAGLAPSLAAKAKAAVPSA